MQKQIMNEIYEKQRNKKNPLKVIFIIAILLLAFGIIHYAINYDKYNSPESETEETTGEVETTVEA